MNTSADKPYLDCAYKLQEYAGLPRRKRSEGKLTWPGRKRVCRRYAPDGTLAGDLLTVVGDPREESDLLLPAMRQGQRVERSPDLAAMRAYARQEVAHLPARLRSLESAPAYPVAVSEELQSLARAADVLC